MNLFRRPGPRAIEPAAEGFGEWLLGLFADGKRVADLPFIEVERLCANAGSLVVGAAYAVPDQFAPAPGRERDARLLARRTADAFRGSLADRQNSVIAWPWDHMATTVAWEARQRGATSEATLGEGLLALGSAYVSRHREQAGAVLRLWQEVASDPHARSGQQPDLARIGREMLAAYCAAPVLTLPVQRSA